MSKNIKTLSALLLAISCAAIVWAVFGPPHLLQRLDATALKETVQNAGLWGPVVIISLMIVSIVFTPIPSAPVAMASGAVYGDLWGTLYVLIGAEAGAILAFSLARFLGYSVIRRWFGDRLDVGLLGSQNVLMATVFITRMLPFISFDIVSYAAGLSKLSFWRFALATLAGIIPASFILAHFGNVLSSANPTRVTIAALALGMITALPFIIAYIRKR